MSLKSDMETPQDLAQPASEGAHSADNGNILPALGKRVREIRDRRGMTRKLVAREAGVSERHLAHLEGGDGNVSIVLLANIARALNVSLIELLAP